MTTIDPFNDEIEVAPGVYIQDTPLRTLTGTPRAVIRRVRTHDNRCFYNVIAPDGTAIVLAQPSYATARRALNTWEDDR